MWIGKLLSAWATARKARDWGVQWDGAGWWAGVGKGIMKDSSGLNGSISRVGRGE